MIAEGLKRQIAKILSGSACKNQALLPCLHVVQERCGYLSEEIIAFLAQELGLPKVEVYSVATFYSMFTLEAQGKFVIRICASLPCYLKGARDVLEAIKKELNVEECQTTADKKFTLEPVSCLGLCDMAPAMMINEKAYGNLTPEKARDIIRGYKDTR